MRSRAFVLLIRGAATLAAFCGLCVAQTRHVPTSACNWIPKLELSEAVGVAVPDGRALVSGRNFSVCWFGLPAGGRIFVVVRTRVPPDWTAAESSRMRKSAAYRPARIPADQAFLYGTHDGGATACVFSGAVYLQVSVSGTGSAAENAARAEKLASKLVSRIEPPIHLSGPAVLARRR